jgi:hypothetical protein
MQEVDRRYLGDFGLGFPDLVFFHLVLDGELHSGSVAFPVVLCSFSAFTGRLVSWVLIGSVLILFSVCVKAGVNV